MKRLLLIYSLWVIFSSLYVHSASAQTYSCGGISGIPEETDGQNDITVQLTDCTPNDTEASIRIYQVQSGDPLLIYEVQGVIVDGVLNTTIPLSSLGLDDGESYFLNVRDEFDHSLMINGNVSFRVPSAVASCDITFSPPSGTSTTVFTLNATNCPDPDGIYYVGWHDPTPMAQQVEVQAVNGAFSVVIGSGWQPGTKSVSLNDASRAVLGTYYFTVEEEPPCSNVTAIYDPISNEVDLSATNCPEGYELATARVVSQSGSVYEIDVAIVDGNIIAHLDNPDVTGPGQYTIQLIFDGEVYGETTYSVEAPDETRCGGEEDSWNSAIGCIPLYELENNVAFFLRWAIGMAGGIGTLVIIYGSFLVMTSTGDPRKLKMGQEIIVSAIAGLMLLILSVFILNLIGVQIFGFI